MQEEFNNESDDLNEDLDTDAGFEAEDDSIDAILDAELARQDAPADTEEVETAPVEQSLPKETIDPAAVAQEPAVETKTPNSLPVALKDKFKNLDPELQAWALKRESDVDRIFSQAENERRFAKDMMEHVVQPYSAVLKANGMNALTVAKMGAEGLYALTAANKNVQAKFVADLINQYGVDVNTLADFIDGTQTQTPQQTAEQKRIAELEAWKAQQEQGVTQQSNQRVVSEIDAFKNDPKNEFFDHVAPHMSVLLGQGIAVSLADAYEKAVAMNKDIQKLLADRAATAKQAEKAGKAVLKTKGASSTSNGRKNGKFQSIDEILREQMENGDRRI